MPLAREPHRPEQQHTTITMGTTLVMRYHALAKRWNVSPYKLLMRALREWITEKEKL